MNQGGANVRKWDIQAHLGLKLQPDSMAHTALRPRPQATLKPIGQMIFISTYHATSPGSRLVNHFSSKEITAQGTISRLHGSGSRCTAVEQLY